MTKDQREYDKIKRWRHYATSAISDIVHFHSHAWQAAAALGEKKEDYPKETTELDSICNKACVIADRMCEAEDERFTKL